MELVDAPERGQFLFVPRGNLVLNQRVELRTPPSSGVRSTDELDQDKLFKQERSALTRLLRLVRAAYKLLL